MKAERVARIHNTNHDRRYNQKLNKFSMMTKKEKSQYLGIQNITSTDAPDLRVRSTTEQQLTSDPVPDEFNHRDHGHVTSVKNQKSCGSCWAFAAAGAFEGSYSSATKVLKSFSAKELLDCSYPAEKKTTKGCRGGHYKRAWLYIGEKRRLASAWDIPYHPIEHDCSKWDGKPNGIRNARYSTWEKSSSVQESVKRTIYSNTPAVMFILEDEFYGYDKGHYDGCSDLKKSKSYHAIILVGYGPDYWEGKNSWGWEWGNKGFVKFTREIDNICKILSRVMYPVVLKEDRGEEDEPDILPDEDLVDIAQGKEVISSDWDVVTAAVDGDEATCYTTSETSSPSFKINFGKKYRVQRVEITTNTASGLIGSKVYVGEMGSYLDDIIGIVEEVEDGKVVLRPAPTEGSWLTGNNTIQVNLSHCPCVK